MFQSPLHWGIAFNKRFLKLVSNLILCFSPLFIGASRSTLEEEEQRFWKPKVSVPSSLGHRVQLFGHGGPCGVMTGFSPLFIGASRSTSGAAYRYRDTKTFQSPLHWGIAFNYIRSA